MTTEKFESFYIIGLSVRTRNEDQHLTNDIHNLWDVFMKKETIHRIPNKLENTLYGVYTDYENRDSGYYTAIVGCKVSTLDTIPDGMIGITINNGTYSKFIAKGDVTKNAIPDTWAKIWKSNLSRTFSTDFEVYDERAINPVNAEVDIFVGVN